MPNLDLGLGAHNDDFYIAGFLNGFEVIQLQAKLKAILEVYIDKILCERNW